MLAAGSVGVFGLACLPGRTGYRGGFRRRSGDLCLAAPVQEVARFAGCLTPSFALQYDTSITD